MYPLYLSILPYNQSYHYTFCVSFTPWHVILLAEIVAALEEIIVGIALVVNF